MSFESLGLRTELLVTINCCSNTCIVLRCPTNIIAWTCSNSLNVKYNKYLNDSDCKPSEAKTKIIGDLNASLTKCLDLEISSIGNIESSQGTLYFKKLGHPTPFEFNVLSSGEKEVVDILLDLYLRKDEYNDTIFLLDEPELHINTSIQKRLLIEINVDA